MGGFVSLIFQFYILFMIRTFILHWNFLRLAPPPQVSPTATVDSTYSKWSSQKWPMYWLKIICSKGGGGRRYGTLGYSVAGDKIIMVYYLLYNQGKQYILHWNTTINIFNSLKNKSLKLPSQESSWHDPRIRRGRFGRRGQGGRGPGSAPLCWKVGALVCGK